MAFLPLHPAVTAVPVGLAFGAILERAGLGDARVIRGQLVGRDFTVILVMFGAIVTAMLGLLWADALGVVDLRALATPPTDLGGQVVGAVIFGCGFGIAALCPGTACVAAAAGKRDGFAAVLGVLLGSVLTAFVWPVLAPAVAAVPQEHRLLPDDLGLPVWVVATAIVLLALGARRIGGALAVQEAPPDGTPPHASADTSWWRLTPLEAVALTLAVSYAAVEVRTGATPPVFASVAGEIVREEDHVDAVELAEWIRAGRRDLRIIDLREELDPAAYLIPGAQGMPLQSLARLEVAPNELVVLYSDGGAHAAQGWVLLRLRGLRNVRVLKDGMAAWEDEIMSPAFVEPADATERADQARRRELSVWFGGRPRTGVRPAAGATGATARARRRRNTC